MKQAKKKIFILAFIIIIAVVVLISFLNKEKSDWSDGPLDILPAEVYPVDLVQGNKEDLQTFSIWPNAKVFMDNIAPGSLVANPDFIQGIVSGNYFSKGKIIINILNKDKQLLLSGSAQSMKVGVQLGYTEFLGKIDYLKLPNGHAFIQIQSAKDKNKSILIPIIINNQCKFQVDENWCKT